MDLSAHRMENMPKCRVIFEKYTESYPENYARKIIWAYKKLQVERDKPFYWSDIRALSGVKKHNFQLARPYCRKNNIIFMYSNIIHHLCIQNVMAFPQDYAAMMTRMTEIREIPKVVGIDIGDCR